MNMKTHSEKYIVTGYSAKEDILRTHIYKSADAVASLLNSFLDKPKYTAKAIEFEAQTRSSHLGAMIIDEPGTKYKWSICYI